MRSELDNIDIIICFFRALMWLYARFSYRKVFLRAPLFASGSGHSRLPGCSPATTPHGAVRPCAARPARGAPVQGIFSYRSEPACGSDGDFRSVNFQPGFTPYTLPSGISDTKEGHWILPDNDPVDYFAAPLRVKKFTPAGLEG